METKNMTETLPDYGAKKDIENRKLGELRKTFTRNLVLLLTFMLNKNYYPMLGRDGEKHKLYSLHFDGLAVDVILTKNDTVLTKTSDHLEFGLYWMSLDPLNCWGGDFSNPDGNHYSMSYLGKK